jgi:hypothetical protein
MRRDPPMRLRSREHREAGRCQHRHDGKEIDEVPREVVDRASARSPALGAASARPSGHQCDDEREAGVAATSIAVSRSHAV